MEVRNLSESERKDVGIKPILMGYCGDQTEYMCECGNKMYIYDCNKTKPRCCSFCGRELDWNKGLREGEIMECKEYIL